MADNSQQCPKCKGAMAQGFILDRDRGHGGRLVSQWAAGAPRKSYWFGTELPEEHLIPIGAFRCAACGYLELYARDDFAAQ